MCDWGVCKDCALKENCAEYKPYKRQCEDYERYKEVLTNEEWFCSLSTEEKAKWLENKMIWAAQEQGTFTAKGWEMWLKAPHTFK